MSDETRGVDPVPGPDAGGTGAGEDATGRGLPGPRSRGRVAVAASILAALLIGGYFAAAPGGIRMPPGGYLLNAVVLVVAFWFPAMRVGSVADLRRQWLPIAGWIVAWTMVWDLATSGILFGERLFFQEWWIVYPAGLVVLGGLLLLHGWAVRWREA